MGCCGSKDEDEESAPSQVVVVPNRAHVAANRGQLAPSPVHVLPSRAQVGSSRANTAASRAQVASSWANTAPSRANTAASRANAPRSRANTAASRANTGHKHRAPPCEVPVSHLLPTIPASTWGILTTPRYQPVETSDRDEVDSIGYSSHHNEERHFFHVFFSVLDHVPGHQGIFHRWEKEAQRVECGDRTGKCNMSNVWLQRAGYVKTLQRVKILVYNKQFRASDREKLAEWAARVVKRRSAEYNKARSQGKADPQHMKVLQEWKEVKEAVLHLL